MNLYFANVKAAPALFFIKIKTVQAPGSKPTNDAAFIYFILLNQR